MEKREKQGEYEVFEAEEFEESNMERIFEQIDKQLS